MGSKLRVGVIFGGRSGEHEVSLSSATTVLGALDRTKYEVVPVGIAKDGQWLVGGDAMRTLREVESGEPVLNEVALGARPAQMVTPALGLASLDQHHLDVVVPMLHGTYGEDGTVQGLLELAKIPYVGSGVLASAVGMDKAVMKDIFRQHGIPIVNHIVLTRTEWQRAPEEVAGQIANDIGYPCFVKPANMGSSVGVSKVRGWNELPGALVDAGQYDRKIIVERGVAACREIEIGVLGNDDPLASVPGEVIPRHEFYDYAAKYLDGGSQLAIPADLPSATSRELQRLAIAAYQVLDCAGMARVDCFLDGEDGSLYVNEVNTIPGFTPTSMYHQLWEASGIGLTELLDRLIVLALERHEEKMSLRTSYRAVKD